MAVSTENVVGMILGGGQGKRLRPLTSPRSKPAVPIGGKYRLIDIPLSNCIHSNINRVFVLTQFNSVSLHHHILRTYQFDIFSKGLVEILAAQQTMEGTGWFQGTADAVRQCLPHITDPRQRVDDVMILSGDHLYRMDYRPFLETHRQHDADVTIAVKPVPRAEAKEFGILKASRNGRILEFVEKPSTDELLDSLALPDADQDRTHLASMGIYVFKRDVLVSLLESSTEQDFGREVIPRAIQTHDVYSHFFEGYWQDIGSIGAFHQANLDLASDLPPFNFYESAHPTYTRPRFLPASKITNCHVERSLVGDGTIIHAKSIRESVVGIRSNIGKSAVLDRTVMLGADYYDWDLDDDAKPAGAPPMGVGPNCKIFNAIIDKNARIGEGCQIVNSKGVTEHITDLYEIHDGIVIIPKNAVLPPGTVI